ncbi:sigma-70 family RNA polymerase sigma factor [Clostridium sp. NSJ-49]|jgi:RNA polymerase sigma factor|uniref:RNA polymerase sigma factor SigI n=1 Tax=Clostridium disporicum TaxID=84024 RepID=A0A174KPP0_9CLOT|nr:MULTISPECIES: sigma-70 family RNA polymerase sigma factor [Clostridium]MBC5626670.1 sigma-70 family RNA polymerase sigma factor [Clostridium sp. NSJ-49]MCD2502398.1 sigma-70 family RNA polymerase sigma factor [Clostridium sp. NSJ-145]MDU6341072.1 sigma-70 family RNA polymerase sigma factor [Clostridium sp.]CUP11200.1 RNA polymerase sigma factor SigI [Clostridium disporicum]
MEFIEENINDIKNTSIDKLIQDYMAFIVKTVSSITGRYVSVENDDELSIALIAFKEAIDKYEESRGSFSSFAKLVISSRVKNYLIKENRNNKVESIEALKDKGIDISEVAETVVEESDELSNEIGKLKNEIEAFGFTFEDLVDEAPKHEDTRRNAIELSEKVSKEKPLTSFMYEKRRLPIKQISVKFSVTEKVIKRSKKFIISVVIIIDKNFRNLRLWIKR